MHLGGIASLPLILLEPSSNSRQYVEDVLSAAGVQVSPEFELGSHDLLLEFAKINLGIACVTKQFARDYLEQRASSAEIPLRREISEAARRHLLSQKRLPVSDFEDVCRTIESRADVTIK